MIIWVKPSLPEEQRADIRALVEDDPYQMVLVPRTQHAVRGRGDRLERRPGAERHRPADGLQRGERQDVRRAARRSATSTARRAQSRFRRQFALQSARFAGDSCGGATGCAATVFGVVVKLLASAAALVCVLALVPPALAARARRLRARGPDRGRARRCRAPRAFNLVGLRWRGRATPDVELRVRRGRGWSRWQHLGVHGRGGLRPGLGGPRAHRPVPPRPARAGLRLHFVAVGKRRATARAAQTTDDAVPVRPARGLGRRQCVPREAPELRQREGGAGAPHGLAERLHAGGGAADRAGDLPLPPQLQRLERHRLQRARRQVRHDLRGPRRRPRPGRDRRPRAGLQLADGRRREHRRLHAPSGRARRRSSATATYIRWKLGVHGQPLSGPVTLTSAGGSASRYPAGAQVTLERVIGHRDTGKTVLPGRRALRPARRDPRAGRGRRPVRDLLARA